MKDAHPILREIAVLQEATEMILSSADVDTILHQILLIVRNHFGVKNCAVFLVDKERSELHCRAQNGYSEEAAGRHRVIGANQGITGWAAETRGPRYVPDVSREPRYLCSDPSVKSELALPLLVRDEVVGVLDLESDIPDHFTDDMIGLLAIFAGQAAVALENTRLYSSELRRMRQIELINLIARSATAASDIEQFLATMAELIYDAFEGSDACILLRDRSGALRLRAHAGPREVLEERLFVSERSGIIAQAFSARMNVVNNDAGAARDWPAITGSGSELSIPLVSFGDTLGVVVVLHPNRNYFNADERAIAQAAADVCATAIKNVQLADELRRVTSTDPLTGSYNQRYFHSVVAQEVSRARRYGKHFSLAMVDLRRFRQVNAAGGFEKGDHVLREVAEVLRSQLRSNDILSRYAADRFAILFPETERDRMHAVLNKIHEKLSLMEVPQAEGTKQALGAVCAHVDYPHDGNSELELVRRLLNRLEEAKRKSSQASA